MQNPSDQPIDISFAVTLQAKEDQLRSYLRDLNDPAASAPIDQLIVASVIRPNEKPANRGYQITTTSVTLDQDNLRFVLKINAIITNTKAVVAEASQCYRTVWQDKDWTPESYGEALFEILIASNATPSPDEVGYEIIDWTYPVDKPVAAESSDQNDVDAT